MRKFDSTRPRFGLVRASTLALMAGIAGVLAFGTGHAFAQSLSPDQLQDEIDRLQAQIGNLQNEQANPPAPAPVPPPAVLGSNKPAIAYVTGSNQFGLMSADGQNSIELTGRLHMDAGSYLNVKPEGGASNAAGPGSPGHGLDSGFNARRARIGVAGKFLGDFNYALIYDFGGSSDSTTNANTGSVTSGLENAYITYNGFNKPTYQVPLGIDLGYEDIPWTLDEATSSNDIMFMERSSSQVVATQFGGGDGRSTLGFHSATPLYYAGLFLTGPAAGGAHTNALNGTDENSAVLGRFALEPVNTPGFSLHVGVNAGALLSSPEKTGLTLSDRPELRVDPTTVLSTGAIGAKSGDVLGAELAAAAGPVFFQGEYFHYMVDQRTGATNPDGTVNATDPNLAFNGGYAEASYSIGGTRHYSVGSGAYGSVVPDHPFSLSGSGMGALEFAVRYSYVDLNDKFNLGTAAATTGGVNGGKQTGIDAGVNWYLSSNLRFMMDYVHTDVTDLYAHTNIPATNLPTGTKIDAIAARAQLTF